MDASSRIAADSLPLTLLVLVGKGFGMLVPLVVARVFGADHQTDAYYLALTVPMFADALLGSTLHAALGPQLARQRSAGGRDAARLLGSALAAVVGALVALCAALAVVLPPLFRWLDPGPEGGAELAITMLPPLLASIPLMGASVVVGSAMEIHGHFAAPAWLPLFKAGAFVGVALLGRETLGVQALAWGFVLGELAKLGWMALCVWRYRLGVELPSSPLPLLRPLAPVLGPLLLGEAAVNVCRLIERSFAARGGPGDLSVLEYADRLQVIPEALLGASLVRVLFSHWAAAQVRGDLDLIRTTFRQAATWLMLALVPGTAAFFFLRAPLVDLLFGGPAFGPALVQATADVALGYMPSLPLTLIGMMCASLLWVRARARVLAAVGLLTVSVTLSLCLALTPSLGVFGIALASSVAQTCTTLTLLRICQREVGGLLGASFWAWTARLAGATLGVSALLWGLVGPPPLDWREALGEGALVGGALMSLGIGWGWAGGHLPMSAPRATPPSQ